MAPADLRAAASPRSTGVVIARLGWENCKRSLDRTNQEHVYCGAVCPDPRLCQRLLTIRNCFAAFCCSLKLESMNFSNLVLIALCLARARDTGTFTGKRRLPARHSQFGGRF